MREALEQRLKFTLKLGVTVAGRVAGLDGWGFRRPPEIGGEPATRRTALGH